MSTHDSFSRRRSDTAQVHRRAVERTILAMDANLAEVFPLERMAEVGLMSPCHFNRVFCHVTGIPPARFLCARRLEVAKRLLLTTELKITDICFEVGYNSLGTFTRRFTELVGVSPGRFRALATAADPGAALRSLQASPEPFRLGPRGHGVSGHIEGPKAFRGLIFVGLFPTAIPQDRPVACAVLTALGSFRLPGVPDGKYYLFAIGLAWSADPKEYLLYEDALRGGAFGRPIVIEKGRTRECTELTLRPPDPIDPPILTTLPLLIGEHLASSLAAGSSPSRVAPGIVPSTTLL